MSKYAFGVDIGGTTIKIGLFEKTGKLFDKWEIPTKTENNGVSILPDTAASILKKMQEKGISEEDIVGVGVGVPGPVDQDGVVYRAVNLGWGIFHIPETLGRYLNFPIKAANDANIAAFGEMWQGGGKGYSNLVAVTLGTGVGGGIIVNGNILTGAIGAGGEIGHIHIEDRETQVCSCTKKGCLEQYTSAKGIVRLAKQKLQKKETPSILRQGKISAKIVFDAVKEGDFIAVETAKMFGEYLGKGLAIVASVVNPEVFVIGGGVSKAGEILLDYIVPVYQKYAFPACQAAQFSLAVLGNDAGIYGAAGLFLR